MNPAASSAVSRSLMQSKKGSSKSKLKICDFCQKGAKYIDYKDYPTLKTLTDYFGNIRKRRETGVCLRHQKMLKTAVERARFMGMLAYRK